MLHACCCHFSSGEVSTKRTTCTPRHPPARCPPTVPSCAGHCACRLATLVHDNGFADGAEFLAAWEAEWQATLDACTPQGECEVLPN